MALTPFGRSNDNRIFDPFHLDSFFDCNGFPSFRSVWDPQALPRDFSSFVGTQVDWKETSDAHVFKANLPGLHKEEVKVHVEDGRVLQISGERRRDETETTDTWHRVERSQGSFMRSFRLPENARMDEVKAAMENGVLTVTIPKAQISTSASRSIQISG